MKLLPAAWKLRAPPARAERVSQFRKDKLRAANCCIYRISVKLSRGEVMGSYLPADSPKKNILPAEKKVGVLPQIVLICIVIFISYFLHLIFFFYNYV